MDKIYSSCWKAKAETIKLVCLTCALPLPRQYMVLVPFLIHTNVPEKVCIQLTHLNESVTLSATLEYAGANRSLIADVVSEKDVFKCIPFTVSI